MTFQKYHKVTRDAYEQWYREHEAYRRQVESAPWRLSYHLMPKTGWLNDPNGLFEKDGLYHIYYQYTPFEPTGELKLWNHCTTHDFIHYEDHGPVLFPDEDFDAHGVYSGSAFPEGGIVHFFYTGNVKYFDRPDYDYIMAGRGSNTVHIVSEDGFHFSTKELLLTTDDYPADISCHVRDPKLLKKDGVYYMALGARDRESRGLVLLYRSEDMKDWRYFSLISVDPPFGYMWECPDLFFLDGKLCLICCPQGVPARGIDYANVHQCTFMVLDGDFESGSFRVLENPSPTLPFQLVDRGFDFYAPQSFLDESGRRILIGWMGIPEADYTNPTTADGWQHALTLPRELSVRDGRLIQRPLEELKLLRAETLSFKSKEVFNEALADGVSAVFESDARIPGENDGAASANDSDAARLENRAPRGLSTVFELELAFSSCEQMELRLREGVFLRFESGVLTLELAQGGYGRDSRSVSIDALKSLRVYSDVSSLEIFINDGEEVFTTRVYSGAENPASSAPRLSGSCEASLTLHRLAGFEIKDCEAY